jgi:hypothetical protein
MVVTAVVPVDSWVGVAVSAAESMGVRRRGKRMKIIIIFCIAKNHDYDIISINYIVSVEMQQLPVGWRRLLSCLSEYLSNEHDMDYCFS